MLVNFTIENFGAIKDKQTLSFEATASTELEAPYIIQAANGLRLLKLGLVYGANASGKTTILNALDFLRDIVTDPADKKTTTFDFNPFLFDAVTPGKHTELSIEFIQEGVRYGYTVTLSKNAVLKEELLFYKPNKAVVFKRTTDSEKQLTSISFGSKIKKDRAVERILEANTLWNNTVPGGFLKTNIELPELKAVTDWFTHYLRPLVLSGAELRGYVTTLIQKGEISKQHVVDILKKADFGISDIFINQEETDMPYELLEYLEKQVKNDTTKERMAAFKKSSTYMAVDIEVEHTVNAVKYTLPFDLESQGTKRFYTVAGILSLLMRHGIFFSIDELEASLHPDLYIHFLLSFLMNTSGSQLLATTHNREILNNRDIFRDDAIWFTDKNEAGAAELYSLADFDSKVIRDTTNVYNAYKAGKLGGVPHLSDYFYDLSHAEK